MPEADDGTWMTKAELARVRRISVASADRLIRRQGWRRQPGNDGRVRVLVPPDWAEPRHANPTDDDAPDPTDRHTVGEISPTDNGLLAGALAALEAALLAADTRAEAAHALVDRTLAQLADAHARADRAETRAGVLRDRVDAAEAAAGQASAEALAARETAEALRRADAERKARGLVARLRAAWRGE